MMVELNKLPINLFSVIGEIKVNGFFKDLSFSSAATENSLCFLEKASFINSSDFTRIRCVVTLPELADKIPEGTGIVTSANPKRLFYEIHNWLARETDFYGESIPSQISETAKIYPNVYIDPKNVVIEDGVTLEPGVTVFGPTRIGSGTVLRAGVTVATPGFEFKRFEDDLFPVEHGGSVVIGQDVEIQANTSISRSVFRAPTFIGDRHSTGHKSAIAVQHGI